MKLTHGLLSAFLGLASAADEYDVDVACANDSSVVITVPYDQPRVELLGFMGGNCNSSSEFVKFVQNETTNHFTVTVDQRACGMRGNSRVTRQLRTIHFDNIVDLKVGRKVNDDIQVVLYNSKVNLTCGVQDDYTVSIEYGKINADYSGDSGIAGGMKTFDFALTSWDKNYTNETTPTNRAGDKVHLQICSSDMPSEFYKFGVLRCIFFEKDDQNATVTEYPLFDYEQDNCENDFLDFSITSVNGTDTKSNAFRISHTVFTFDPARDNTYSLTCALKLCDYDVADSVKVCDDMEKNCKVSPLQRP